MTHVVEVRHGDKKLLVFDYYLEMEDREVVTYAQVSISVWVGADTSPARLLSGRPLHYRFFVEQYVGNDTDPTLGFAQGVAYLVTSNVITSRLQRLTRSVIVRCLVEGVFEPPPPVPPPLPFPLLLLG